MNLPLLCGKLNGERKAGNLRKGQQVRLRLFAAICAVVAVGAIAPTVRAAKPVRIIEKGHAGDVYNFPAGSVCPFEVSVEFVRREGSFFTFSNGVQKLAYTFWLNVTNVDTGETRVLHEAGSVVVTSLSDDVIETVTNGQELSIYPPGQLGPDSPGAFLFITGSSRDVSQIGGSNPDPIFGLTTLSFEVNGYTENLCETMA